MNQADVSGNAAPYQSNTPATHILCGGGEMGECVRNLDWSTTLIGPVDTWPQSLKTVVQITLDCGFPMIVLWGPQLIQIYNDGYRDLMGVKHPTGLGQPTQACWPEVWYINAPIYERVWQGETVTREDTLYPITHHDVLEDAFFTLCYSPLRDETSAIAGVLVTVFETTARLRAAATREASLQRALDERMQAEIALHTSEERVRLATNAAELGIWEWDIEADHVAWQNDQSYTMFGLPPSTEPVNAARFVADFVHPDDVAAFERAVSATMETGALFFEGRIRRTDGALRWVAFTGYRQATIPGARPKMFGIAADITARKQAEAAIRESEERYRRLFESIDVGFCIIEVLFDVRQKPFDYRFLEVNPAFQRQTGLLDAKDRTARELVPKLEAHWFEIYGNVALTGEAIRFIDGSDAMNRWFDVYAFRVGEPAECKVAVLFNDITQRKIAEQALAERERLLSTLLKVSDTARELRDEQDIACEACRLVKDEIGGVSCSYGYVYPEEDRVHIVADVCDEDDGVPSIEGNWRLSSFGPNLILLHEQGHPVMIEDTATHPTTAAFQQTTFDLIHTRSLVSIPLVRDGRFTAYFAIHDRMPRHYTEGEVSLLHDVAVRVWEAIQRSRAEAALCANETRLQVLYAQEQEARAQAEAASRLKDEFLATVSHELRTPLTAILGYSQLLQRRKHDEAYLDFAVEKMVRSAKVQAELIDDLLDVSRIVSGKLRIAFEPTDLRAVVHAALDTMRPAMEAKGLHVQIDLSPAASIIVGDANRLQQVVWNLLSNAAKFTPAGGTLTVRLECYGRDAQLTVSDTGQGISADFLPFVFDRFRQADSTSNRVYGGLGLGLSIVRHLIELHGGTVQASSAGVGQGATFSVRLPLAGNSEPERMCEPADAVAAITDCSPTLRGLRVLIVDDQLDILELLHDVLVACGAVVRMSPSARDALAAVRFWQPDVLVSDIAMPSEDGYWLIRSIRALAAEHGGMTPAVALTAYVRIEERMRVLAAGFQLYVPKPIEPNEIRNIVASLVRMADTEEQRDSTA